MKTPVFDSHTHVLPGIDDGSRSVEESVAMLRALKDQGVDLVAATPHFYADRISPEKFFARRQAAWDALKDHLEPDFPEIRLGAEVRYFEGITRYDQLERFRIEGTNLLLLEMPHGPWTSRMLSAVAELNARENVTVLLAHIERFFREQKKDTWSALLELGVQMQVSAEFFTKRGSRRAAMKLLQTGRLHFLGTDCHNTTSRKPDMGDALDVIRRKSGEEVLQKLWRHEKTFL